jgi:hypothetical protein
MQLLARLPPEKGEFTVVANIGQMTDHNTAAAPRDEDLAHQFGELTINRRQSRRHAIAELARRHRLSANEVYEAIERAKTSGD